MYIRPGVFTIDGGVEEVILSGCYEIKEICNDNLTVGNLRPHIDGQIIYHQGNVLYRTQTKYIDEIIKFYVRYSYDPCTELESEFEYSIKSTTQLKQWPGGYPTKRILMVYKSKVFVAYGGYSFGRCKTYAKFERKEPIDFGNIFHDEYKDFLDYDGDGSGFIEWFNSSIRDHQITSDIIILGVPKIENDDSESIHAFLIYDNEYGILDAFGLYR